MEKITITPEFKYKFNVEILLSEAQLLMIVEMNGWGPEEFETLASMEFNDKPITSNPNFEMGLGSDINDFITTGFLAEKAINKDLNTPITHNDLYYSGYRIKVHQIYSIDSELIDCEIDQKSFIPCLKAKDKNGNTIHVDDIEKNEF